jgi:hypothetical protein
MEISGGGLWGGEGDLGGGKGGGVVQRNGKISEGDFLPWNFVNRYSISKRVEKNWKFPRVCGKFK